MTTHVLGLDMSLTAPGVAAFDAAWTDKTVPKRNLRDGARLAAFYAWLRTDVMPSADVAIVEGYSHGSPFGREALGELGGVVKFTAFQLGLPLVVVQPKSLKKYATGKGNASKDDVLVAAVKRSGGLEFDSNNASDAWWLRQMGLAWYDPESAVDVPASHKEALSQIDWPVL